MILDCQLRHDDHVHAGGHRRYVATEAGHVICNIDGGAYIACTVSSGVNDRQTMAEVLAEALNRNPFLTA